METSRRNSASWETQFFSLKINTQHFSDSPFYQCYLSFKPFSFLIVFLIYLKDFSVYDFAYGEFDFIELLTKFKYTNIYVIASRMYIYL